MALFHLALSFSSFLVLVADHRGLSLYGRDRICSILSLVLNEYIQARDELIDEDLIAFNGRLFQALSLPKQPQRSEIMQPPLLPKKVRANSHLPAPSPQSRNCQHLNRNFQIRWKSQIGVLLDYGEVVFGKPFFAVAPFLNYSPLLDNPALSGTR
jgi:hypothetical protein